MTKRILALLLLLLLSLSACEEPPDSGVVTMSYVTQQTTWVGKVPIITWYSNVSLDNGYFMYEPTMTLFAQCQVGETWTKEKGCP